MKISNHQKQKRFYVNPDDNAVMFAKVQKAIKRNQYCGLFETRLLSTYNRFIIFGSIAVRDFNEALEHKRLCPHENRITYPAYDTP